MTKEQYITVSEFAKRSNVSRQYVYKQIDKKLSEYVKVVDNKKMVNIKALKLFKDGTVSQPVEQLNNNLLTDSLQTQIQQLQEQIKIKDKQIEELNTIIKQEQALHLATQQKLMLLEQKKDSKVEENTPKDQPVEPVKKSWWQFWK